MDRYDNDSLVFNKREFVFLIVCAIIINAYKNKNKKISEIEYSEGRIIVILDDLSIEYSNIFEIIASTCERLSDGGLLYNLIDLLIKTINKENIDIFVKFVNSLHLKTTIVPDQLFKYVSNKTDYYYKLFKNTLTFSNRDCFDDIYDSDIPDDVFFNDKKLKDVLRILCLSTSNSNNALWGLYANKFDGFCFQYDRDDILESIERNYPQKRIVLICEDYVHFDENDVSLILCTFIDSSLANAIDIIKNQVYKCFYKDKSWSFLEEYRFIILSNCKEEDYFEIPINYSSYYYYVKKEPIEIRRYNDLIDEGFINSTGVWFLLTYLYHSLIKDTETRYKNRNDYEKWISYINKKILDKYTILSLLDYIDNNCLKKDTKNDGGVTLQEQKDFLNEIRKYLNDN